MCGISLILRKHADQNDCQSAIERMVQAQAHRGPDGHSIKHLRWGSEEIWVGHNLLSISGTLELSRQPMLSEDGNCGIIFNGEIYNAGFLKSQLRLDGHIFSGDSDTEVLLHWLQHNGRRGLKMLEGMYAFVFWDSRKQLLIINRDTYGMKPLFYARSRNYFIISSEPAGIFASGLFPCQPDPEALPYYLKYKFVPPPATAWKGIYNLQPGECIEYWENKPMHFRLQHFPEVHFGGISDAIDKAFSAVIPSGIPFGISFSGGIDSGLILAWCLTKGLKPVIFSVRFAADSSGYADTLAVEEIADKFGLDICWVESDEGDFDEACICPAEAGPLVADSAYILSRKIAGAAHSRGLRVLLSGAGADEWFGGYRRHAFFRKWLSIEDKIPQRLLSWGISALKPGKLRWSGTGGGSAENLWQSAVSSCLSSSLQDAASIPLPAGKDGLLDQMIRWDQQHYLPGDVLWITDMAGMSFSIETRFPFLHPSITDYADSIPITRRMGSGRKEMLADLFRQQFGRKLAGRRKQGFGISAPAFLNHPESQKELDNWLEEIKSVLPGLWNESSLAEFRTAALKDPSTYLQEWMSLGRLAYWLRGFRQI